MAGLIGLTASDIDVQDATGAIRWAYEGEWVPHPVVRLTTTLPVAVTAEDAVREVQRVRWGFPVGPRPVGNARDDKLQQSPLWSKMLGEGHALFVTTGIYEMIAGPSGKQAYWFRRCDQSPIVMPGLVAPRNIKGEERLCGAIITTLPNGLFGQYHDRQVCSLEADRLDDWMAADAAEAMELLSAAPDEAWEAVPIDNRIFAKGRREMEDLVPVGEPQVWDPDGSKSNESSKGPVQATLGDG